jgi:TonB family protein
MAYWRKSLIFKVDLTSLTHRTMRLRYLLVLTGFLFCSSLFAQECKEMVTLIPDGAGGTMHVLRTGISVRVGDIGEFLANGAVTERQLFLMLAVSNRPGCYKTGDRVQFEFQDGTKFSMQNVFHGGCTNNLTFAFSSTLNNLDTLEHFKTKPLREVTFIGKPHPGMSKLTVSLKENTLAAQSLMNKLLCLSQLIDVDTPVDSTYKAPPANTTVFEDEENLVFTVVEDQPDFVGGYEAMIQFIKTNLEMPKDARRKGIDGTVYVQFVIDKDGSIGDVRTIRGIMPSVDSEAERVISIMPKWDPGRQNGKPVKVRFVLPVRFRAL